MSTEKAIENYVEFYRIYMEGDEKTLELTYFIDESDESIVLVKCSKATVRLSEVKDFNGLLDEVISLGVHYIGEDTSGLDEILAEYPNQLLIRNVTLDTPCGDYVSYED